MGANKESKSFSMPSMVFIVYVPKYKVVYLLVSLTELNALVVGNGSYILWPCGHDLWGMTMGKVLLSQLSVCQQGIPHGLWSQVLSEDTPVL